MNELRKVIFRLDDTEYGAFDLNDEEREEMDEFQKPQEGLFHQWGIEIITDEDTGISLQKTVGIVEDSKGEIHKVNPELIKFEKES